MPEEWHDREYVERAVRNARALFNELPRWVAVKRVFGCGSTKAKALCLRFDLDPEEVLRVHWRQESEDGA